MNTKKCSICGIEKLTTEFHNNSSRVSGLTSACKLCRNAYQREHYSRNRLKELERKRKYHRENRERISEYRKNRAIEYKEELIESRLLRKYGITLKQKQQMIASQNGKCAICGKELDMGLHTHVDHNHETGKIRKILCISCNTGLGCFRDDSHIIRLAADYIDKHMI